MYLHGMSSTAFVAKAGWCMQIMLAIESIMDRVAVELELSPEHVRSLNMYREGEKAVCRQAVEAGQVSPAHQDPPVWHCNIC